MRHYEVTPEQADFRLDRTLSSMLPEFTRSFIQKMIEGGCVFIDHKKITKVSIRVKSGQKLVLVVPAIQEVGIQPEKIPLKVVYEDDDILVVDKPAGMVVHPTDRGAHVSGTLVNAVMHHCPSLSGIGGQRRPGIVHRLDKDTSGLIVVAKNDRAHQFLAKQWAGREIVKKYIALISGPLKPASGSIEAPLLIERGEKDVRVSNRTDAKYALTHYHVQKIVGDCSLVEIQIITGRTHQIRVHFASIGHPVCGDEMYGDAALNTHFKEAFGLTRQFLHAASLKFRLPKNNEWIELAAPLPADLKAILKRLRR
ncbi:RluA family pseudouridine synthase [Candidatus Peregrinibacteria bacterium]|nr:RluA family pseudouridine synthase [Candidatus Peregrinibacteria bacterium]